MKILWATPFNARSAIAAYSRAVALELAQRGYEVEILRTEDREQGQLQPLDVDLRVWPAGAERPMDFDLAIVNYGDSAPFHARTLALTAAAAPLAIFHDCEFRNFAWGMREHHGISIPLLPGAPREDPRDDSFDLVDPQARPLLQALAGMACGAVVHGRHYQPTVEEACAGPVRFIPLYVPRTEIPQAPAREGGPFRVTIFGIINPNKQAHRVLRAIAGLQAEFGAVELHLAGAISPQHQASLVDLCTELGVNRPVFYGYLPDADLSQVILQSDAVCCLRFPVMEGGSGSLITALYHGRPLVVANVASYAAVPDGLVSKVSYGEGTADLAEALAEIFRNRDAANARAQEAQTWALETCSAAAYVDALEPVIADALRRRPIMEACRTLARTALGPVGATTHTAVKAVAATIEDLYGGTLAVIPEYDRD